MTCRVGSRAEKTPTCKPCSTRDAGCTVVGKTSMLHVTEVLRTTRKPAPDPQVAGVSGRARPRVIYDAEHFFDGYKLDADYACRTIQAAVEGGASLVVLCDTNGGSMP